MPPPLSAKEPLSDPRSRRRRLFLYVVAFGLMLALSSVLDVRRATLRNRNAKVQLSLPSASLSSLSDGLAVGANGEAPTQTVAHREPVEVEVPAGGSAVDPNVPMAVAPTSTGVQGVGVGEKVPADGVGAGGDVNLSDQELKDDVDQLLAHVAEEEGKGIDGGVANGTTGVSGSGVGGVKIKEEGGGGVKSLASSFLGVVGGSAAEEGANGTVAGVEGDVKLNSEEVFEGAQRRMEALLGEEGVKKFADENDLRTLQALALQATRGDCEQKSGAEKSLFKTDAEAASNVDIERTDPLWGAWCLFVGSYKTDAMRDYVTKQRVVEDKMMAAKAAEQANMTLVGTVTKFDPNAASLDDVLTPEQQSGLRSKMDTIASHLHESDVRYLAALSLQATFGDCGPYGKEKAAVLREGETAIELRKLREPLLDQTVVRREGAQWGAWCVLQGKKRTSAAAELSHRVDLLIDQWAKSQTGAAAETGGSEESLVADGAVVKAIEADAESDDVAAS